MKILFSFTLLFYCFDHVLLQDGPVVDTVSGKVRGKTVTLSNSVTVNAFLGIPYAEPPIGNLRFQKPSSPKPWNEVINATKFSKACYQPIRDGVSEDCLYLNVWSKPSTDVLKPVMVWIYGGAFVFGSASDEDGSLLAGMFDVVVVSMNYRLGAFGFLNAYTKEVPGNMGIYDQSLALRWVAANIHRFGGDANKITLVGLSAGSMSIHAHLMSPLDHGLFRRAIMMSGSLFHPRIVDSPEESLRKANRLAKLVNCSTDIADFTKSADAVTRCLRRKSPEEIITASQSLSATFLPSYNTEVMPLSPIIAARIGRYNKVDLLAGTVSGEGAFAERYFSKDIAADTSNNITINKLLKIVKESATKTAAHSTEEPDTLNFYLDQAVEKMDIRDSLRDFMGDNIFICPTLYFLEHYSEKNTKVYHYQFSHRSALATSHKWLKAPHGSDESYIFGKPLDKDSFTEEDKKLSLKIMSAWTSFVKSGTPSDVNGNQWPRFTKSHPLYVDIKSKEFQILKGLRKLSCDFWRKYFYKF